MESLIKHGQAFASRLVETIATICLGKNQIRQSRKVCDRSSFVPILLLLFLFVFSTSIVFSAREEDQTIGWPGETLFGSTCFGDPHGYGPYDYKNPDNRSRIELVERYHFTREVETLQGGKNSSDSYGDLNYTIGAIPNHHRALYAMSNYYLQQLSSMGHGEMLKRARVNAHPVPTECFFNRAMVFAPEDHALHVLYGIYLHKRGKTAEALERYLIGESQRPQDGELAHNIGLLYFDLGDLRKAEEYAEKAQKLGFPLTGLQKKINSKKTTNKITRSEE